MKRRIVVMLAAVLLVCSAVGAFAFEQKSKTYPWMASFDKTGQINIYAGVGFYYYGIDVGGGPGIPLAWGIAVKGLVGFANFGGFTWIDWGLGPLVTLHWGVDGGGPLKFDFYGGLGLGISGSSANYGYFSYGSGIGFGFASDDGVAWHFSNNISAILDYAYFGYYSLGEIGLRFDL
jgi:hypothetical protein